MQSSEFMVSSFQSPIGEMLIVTHQDHLYLLDFIETKNIERKLKLISQYTKVNLQDRNTHLLVKIKEELTLYFSGKLRGFSIPYKMIGTTFQCSAWNTLTQIQYGTTTSYAHQANQMGKPTAYRAVAQANSCNQLVLIIPCHRIINSNGSLGGMQEELRGKIG